MLRFHKLKRYTPEQIAISQVLLNVFGIKTKNIYIYQLAFRHKSNANEIKTGIKASYERLEFLGDAVLGLVVAEYLFKKYPFKTEGFLTNLRSKIVCGKFLTKTARKLGIDKLINTQNKQVCSSVPEDVFESLIGAIYIDKGFEYTKSVIIERIINIHIDIDELIETETNFKSRLIEWSQREKTNLLFEHKEILNSAGKKQYLIEAFIDNIKYCQAIHNSIKEGEQLAAENTIEKLKNEGKYSFEQTSN